MLVSDPTSATKARAAAMRGPARSGTGVLLVGHGSRSPAGVAQMHQIADEVAASMPSTIVELGFLEMSDPPAAAMVDELIARGCRDIALVPLLLLAAGHAKSDVPALLLEAAQRHPEVRFRYGSPLGVTHELVGLAGANLASAGADGMPLLVIGRGTADPDANAEAAKAARLLAEWNGSPLLHVGYTGMTWPLVPQALEEMALLAGGGFAVFFWFLSYGLLIERAQRDIAAFTLSSGIKVVDAGYFGPDPGLVVPITRRIEEAVAGEAIANCDTCRFRMPFPGHESDVGRPIGVGHSHLAADHRAGHDGHSHDHDGHDGAS